MTHHGYIFIWIFFLSWMNYCSAFLTCLNRKICRNAQKSSITYFSNLQSKNNNSSESLWLSEDNKDGYKNESLDKYQNHTLSQQKTRRRRTVGVGRLGYNVTTLHRANFDLPTYFDLNDHVTYSIRIALLRNYLKKYGDLNVPFRYTVYDVADYDLNGVIIGTYRISLGKWLTTLRRKFQSDPSKIPAIYKEQLDKLGMDWGGVGSGRRPTTFRKRCDELTKFVNTHGHDRVPVFGPTKSLGMWVERNRSEYKRFRNGQPSSLTLDRIEMLQDAGMTLDRNNSKQRLHERFEKDWYLGLELWKKYKKSARDIMGDTISKLVEAGVFQWYHEQQIAYELYNRRMKLSHKPIRTPLTPQRLDLLTREGVVHQDNSLLIPLEGLESLEFSCQSMIDSMTSYKERFGTTEISLNVLKSLSSQQENIKLYHFQQRLRWENRHSHLIGNITSINWLLLEDGFDLIGALNALGFSWYDDMKNERATNALQSEFEWWDMFHDLARYKNTNGDFNLEPNRPWYSHDLSDWLDEQNAAYNKLMNDQLNSKINKMSELHCMSLYSIGYNFQNHTNIDPLATTRRKSSVLSLEKDLKYDSQVLSDDLIRYLSLSKLTDGIDKTEHLAWLVRYETLRRIGQSNLQGSRNVDSDDKIKQRLYLWVRNQQKQYKNYIQGKKSTLTSRRIDMLHHINFDFDCESRVIHEKDTWDEMILALSEFKREHGHCFVPLIYAKNVKLGEWIHLQRQIYMTGISVEDPGTTGTMSTKNKQQLVDLGLDFTMDNTSFSQISFNVIWKERLTELKRFKKIHGHCDVPKDYSSQYYDLALWIQEQRLLKKLAIKGINSQLDARRLKELEEIGAI